MKNSYLHKFFALLFALFFFVFGTGFNIVKFCCSDCEKEGIFALTAETCCDCIHQHHSETESHSLCHHSDEEKNNSLYTFSTLNSNENTNSCNIERLSVETPTIDDVNSDFQTNNFSITLFSAIISFISTNEKNEAISPFPNYFSVHYLSSGREILNRFSLLLI